MGAGLNHSTEDKRIMKLSNEETFQSLTVPGPRFRALVSTVIRIALFIISDLNNLLIFMPNAPLGIPDRWRFSTLVIGCPVSSGFTILRLGVNITTSQIR
ncbi:hypothetical protein QBC43DRAFT_291705 [Cladorrhinum sp. PSN259]|nr:hypothetical protein QBC43DRAFT_291705 [Cladorrhinum sp. PSN259]